MKRHPKVIDPHAGRFVVDFAYSRGCLFALGERECKEQIHRIVEDRSVCRTDAAKHALLSQFRMGQQHETERGRA